MNPKMTLYLHKLNRLLNWVLALSILLLIGYQQHLLFRSWANQKANGDTLVRLQLENSALRQTQAWQGEWPWEVWTNLTESASHRSPSSW